MEPKILLIVWFQTEVFLVLIKEILEPISRWDKCHIYVKDHKPFSKLC